MRDTRVLAGAFCILYPIGMQLDSARALDASILIYPMPNPVEGRLSRAPRGTAPAKNTDDNACPVLPPRSASGPDTP